MKYSRVYIDAIGYELAPIVVSTAELETRLDPLYRVLHLPTGQLEALTGIVERRWWEADFPVSQGAIRAAKKALSVTDVKPSDLDVLIYAGVCRENFEPATACRVAAGLGVGTNASVFDVSNACLGVLNGIIDVANRIELGQIRAGLVVSCETSREINEIVIDRLLQQRSMELFKEALATLTGGSGAVAVLVTDGSFDTARRRQLLGGATQTAPQHHMLCRWGLAGLPLAVNQCITTSAAAMTQMLPAVQSMVPSAVNQLAVDTAGRMRAGLEFGLKHLMTPFMATDAVAVLKYGVELGSRTWQSFLGKVGWASDHIDRVICHQVGIGHRDAILKALGIPREKEFSTFEYLGNIGTVSLPLTAALAEESEFLRPGDKVGLLGIGSGLNCLMLGVRW